MMVSFQDEITAIRHKHTMCEICATFPPVVNTEEDVKCFKRDGPSVVDAICEDIRGKIREKAEKNIIEYDIVKRGFFLFPRFEKVNPHYTAEWNLYVKFDEKIGFSYESMRISEENDYYSLWSREFDHMGLFIKNPEFSIKIMEAVAQQLEQDNILSIAREIIRDDVRDAYAQEICRRVKVPTEDQLSTLNKYFAGDVRHPGCRNRPTYIFSQFVYFI